MRLRFLILFFLALAAGLQPAAAQICNFSISNINFGNISALPGGAPSTSGTFQATCIGTPNATVTICPNINAGTGGTATGSPRYMAGGGNLPFDLLQPNGQVWGSATWGFAPRPPTLSLNLGTLGVATLTQTITASINGSIAALPAGSYVSRFNGGQTDLDYGYAPSMVCSSSLIRATQAHFTVQANVNASCSIATAPLSFGTLANLITAQQVTGSLSVLCSSGAAYTINLNYGTNGGTGPTNLYMVSPATSLKLSYGLYQDAAHNLPWGQSGGNSVSGTGTGTSQSVPIYAAMAAQGTPPSGTYTDTVVVTVNY